MSTQRITTPQREALRDIRARRLTGPEIAPTTMRGEAVVMYFDKLELTIGADGTRGSRDYGPEIWHGLQVGETKRPVDLLAD